MAPDQLEKMLKEHLRISVEVREGGGSYGSPSFVEVTVSILFDDGKSVSEIASDGCHYYPR